MNQYNLELEKVLAEIKKIKKSNPKILIQLAEGLKPRAKEIQEFLEEKFKKDKINCELFFWLGSCYGKCDIPNVDEFDLIIQFGH